MQDSMSTTSCLTGGATTQILDLLFHQLAADVPAHPVREEPRFPIHAPITMGVRVGHNQEYKALDRGWALDISRHGLALLLEHEIPQALEMFVNLDALTQRPCIVPVRVVYSRQLLPRAHRIGAIFLLDDVEV
jgi:hypothetical protein